MFSALIDINLIDILICLWNNIVCYKKSIKCY